MWMLLVWLLQELQHDVYIIFTKQRDITRLWSADIQRVERSSNCYTFFFAPLCYKVYFINCLNAILWNVTLCVLLTVSEGPLPTRKAVTLHGLISPFCHWCGSDSQITGLIVCTRCNHWSAGNLFGLEGFFSSCLSPAVALFPCG